MLQNTKKRATRRGWPIHGYVGPNGGGKSAAMVWDTLPSLDAGRPVLSTVRLLDYQNPRPCEGWRMQDGVQVECETCQAASEARSHEDDDEDAVRPHMQAHPLWVPLRDWKQLMEASKCDVLLDEVTGVASSRTSQSLPAPVANKLVQLRRVDCVVRWSAPAWARADLIIRECSQAVTYCQGFLTKESGEADRMWRQRRLFKWKTYDAQLFEDFTSGKRESLGAELVDWHWGPRSPAFGAYDTYDAVSTVGTVTDAGRCYECGGKKSIPACRCDHSPVISTPKTGAGGRPKAVPGPVPAAGKRRADVRPVGASPAPVAARVGLA